jgi:hypothetical protein
VESAVENHAKTPVSWTDIKKKTKSTMAVHPSTHTVTPQPQENGLKQYKNTWVVYAVLKAWSLF